MEINLNAYEAIAEEAASHGARLIAVSKTKSAELVRMLYDIGHRDFGENYVQELTEKRVHLPDDIRWHFIGHLQSNKARQVCPFIHLIHGVDSVGLLKEIGKQSQKKEQVTDVLLQLFIATEETKFGLSETEARQLLLEVAENPVAGIRIRGLMGMASLTEKEHQIAAEFRGLKQLFEVFRSEFHSTSGFSFDTLSMGMTSDYKIALAEGSNMIRIGSAIFGTRS
jgi:pyridoxal phosphate enzyme (YggS family)